MASEFDSPEFGKFSLWYKGRRIVATVRSPARGNTRDDDFRTLTTGLLAGRVISGDISKIVPGTIFKNVSVLNQKMNLIVQSVPQSRIQEVTDSLGPKIQFEYAIVSEFKDC